MSHVSHRWRRRAAATIYEHLCPVHAQKPITLPHDDWSRLESLARQTTFARQRNWHAAARRSLESLVREADYLRSLLFSATAAWQSQAKEHPLASESDLVRDLMALETEFNEVELDEASQTLAVSTDSIVLEGINLGPFELLLDLAQLPSLNALRVVARAPNPAVSNDEVTHPHVQSERPCLGEGMTACQKALEEGRLLDFFVIVAQVLATYAPGRAYVELEDWQTLTCRECGDSVSDSGCCPKCQAPVCRECCGTCQECDDSYCQDCLRFCRSCDREVCERCLGECAHCKSRVCRGCLENDLCTDCNQQDSNEEEEDEPNETPKISPLQPHCVGKTSLSARSG